MEHLKEREVAQEIINLFNEYEHVDGKASVRANYDRGDESIDIDYRSFSFKDIHIADFKSLVLEMADGLDINEIVDDKFIQIVAKELVGKPVRIQGSMQIIGSEDDSYEDEVVDFILKIKSIQCSDDCDNVIIRDVDLDGIA